jgi:hypothetical protein
MARGIEVDRVLRQAIAERRLVTFEYQGLPRIGEPHDYGRRKGKDQLNFFQTGGRSRSGKVPDWRTPDVDGIRSLALTPERFAGTRPTPSGRHLDWDELYASVTPR